MKKIFHLILIISFLLTSCLGLLFDEEEPDFIMDDNGVVTKQPHLWRTQLVDKAAGNWSGIKFPVCNEKITVAIAEQGGEYGNGMPVLYGLDNHTGDIVWQNKQNLENFISNGYQFDSKYIYDNRNSISCLDINTGNMDFTIPQEGWFNSDIIGFNARYYIAGLSQKHSGKYDLLAAWEGNIISGAFEEILVPEIGLDTFPPDTSFNMNIAGGVSLVIPFTVNNGVNYLVVFYDSNITPPNIPFVLLYNNDTKEIIYDISAHSGTLVDSGIPIIKDEKIYVHAIGHLYCMDIFTQEIIWEHKTGLRYENLAISGDYLMVVRWGLDPELQVYDRHSGRPKWIQEVGSGGSPLIVHNEIIYYVSHYLYAFEISTGKMYWKMECPDEELDSEAYFSNHCVVIPGQNGEKGRVIANGGMSTFCYEAIR